MKLEWAYRIVREYLQKKHPDVILETEWEGTARVPRLYSCAVVSVRYTGLRLTLPGCPGVRWISRRRLAFWSEEAVRSWAGQAVSELRNYGRPRKGIGGKSKNG